MVAAMDTVVGYSTLTFDGTDDYLSKSTALTGAANGKLGLASCWFRIDGTVSGWRMILSAATKTFYIGLDSSSLLAVFCQNASGTRIHRHYSSAVTSDVWHHLLAAWDLGSAESYIYVDDVSVGAGANTLTDDECDYDQTDWEVGRHAVTDSAHWEGAISELYFTNEYLDISQEVNRRKFIDAYGAPVDLGSDGSTPTGTAPLIYLAPVEDAEGTNAGSGGDFDVNGAPVLYSIRSTVGTPDEDDRAGFYPTEERWYMCARDGWWYPKSETRVEKWSGLRVCLKDYEEESHHNETFRSMRLQSIFRRREEQIE